MARLLLADFDPAVEQIFAQPCWMVARGDGQVRRHVPDYLLATPGWSSGTTGSTRSGLALIA
ncbi:hypothetical protein [Nonomuraea sp. CA-141351]|uniref:hypothetical protein n=1 Tax=Nonomuraea sp. CA-141351 TaxID=3239996 RepID=UPI003D919ECC